MKRALVLTVSLIACGCGGSSKQPDTARPARVAQRPPIEPVVAEPVEVSVKAQRLGQSLHLDIAGVGRGHEEGQALEDPAHWRVTAFAGEVELVRMVNGPVRVDRHPVGSVSQNRWDVHVRFSVAFAIPEAAADVRVVVQPPATDPVTVVVD